MTAVSPASELIVVVVVVRYQPPITCCNETEYYTPGVINQKVGYLLIPSGAYTFRGRGVFRGKDGANRR